ncbi:hypothetical protein [Mycobacterium sp. ACS4331]|uniref:hypothetical protein n=1 Tax=Mycobacterium sp. ACS4331 TaxID=1834121 RepID=UPI0007FC931E|nr:hypothetical protein [Mycobacterium sp. ACS4331]OBF25674.1 hypothetical protein A5727_03895 [Mycobacterium sp. ACS4331]
MAMKTIVTSGVALVSAAAIIAATPEVLRPPTVEVAAVQEGVTPSESSPGSLDVTALSMLGALNAFFKGYNGADSLNGPLVPKDVDRYLAGGAGGRDGVVGDDPATARNESVDDWNPWTGVGTPSLLYYFVDEGIASQGIRFDYDDILFSAGPRALLAKIVDDLGLSELVDFVVEPVVALAGVVGINLRDLDPTSWVKGGLRDGLKRATETLADILNIDAYLPPAVVAVLRDPVGALIRVIQALVPSQRPTASASARLQVPSGETGDDATTPSAVEKGTASATAERDLDPKTAPAAEGGSPQGGESPVAAPSKVDARVPSVIADQVKAIRDGLKDAKAKAEQARAEYIAARTEAITERTLERLDRVRARFGGKPKPVSESGDRADSGSPETGEPGE